LYPKQTLGVGRSPQAANIGVTTGERAECKEHFQYNYNRDILNCYIRGNNYIIQYISVVYLSRPDISKPDKTAFCVSVNGFSHNVSCVIYSENKDLRKYRLQKRLESLYTSIIFSKGIERQEKT